jgi:hypothetical protein
VCASLKARPAGRPSTIAASERMIRIGDFIIMYLKGWCATHTFNCLHGRKAGVGFLMRAVTLPDPLVP